MEDSLKGVLIAATIILIFITCILNFIVLFPQEQGVTFTNQSLNDYLQIQNNTDLGINVSLNNLQNSTSTAFDQWDITQGFMGSNQMKQGQVNAGQSVTQIFSSLSIISTLIFKQNSPVLTVLGILSILAGIVIIYYVYSFIRTGR